MLNGVTDTKITELLQVDRKTLYRWRTDNPRFKQALAQRREDLFGHQLDLFLNGLTASLETLTKQTADEFPPTAHCAARTLLLASRLGHHLGALATKKL
jgi:hypothetical protein